MKNGGRNVHHFFVCCIGLDPLCAKSRNYFKNQMRKTEAALESTDFRFPFYSFKKVDHLEPTRFFSGWRCHQYSYAVKN